MDELPLATYRIDDYNGSPEYNLNVFHNLNQSNSIEDYLLICCFHTVSFEALCHKYPDFRSDTRDQSMMKQAQLVIPVLPDSFTGDVFLDYEYIAEDAFKKFWNGGDRYEGFLTKTPPLGTHHVRAKIHKEFQFVYKGFSSRTVARTKKIFLLNNIKSIDDFNERFTNIIKVIAS